MKRVVVLTAVLFLAVVFYFGKEVMSGAMPGMEPYTPTKAEWIAVQASAISPTGLQIISDNDYICIFINPYIGEDSETIVISCGFSQGFSTVSIDNMMSMCRRSINSVAESHGWDSWVKIKEEKNILTNGTR